MKRYFIAFIAACVAIVSCQSDPFQEPVLRPDEDQQENGGNVQDPEPEVPEIMDAREVTIEAGILTKTVLNTNDNSVLWEGGDKIALVFRHSTDANEFHVNKTFVNQEQDPTVNTAKATFKGMLANKVTTENGYNDLGFAVYPQSAVDDATGNFIFNLPSNQVADADGSFGSEMNLSSAALSLSEMGGDKTTKSDFRNALSLLKVSLSPDIESVTLTGTALAGVVPLKMHYNSEKEDDPNNGRLTVDPDGDFSNAVNSVTLTPPQGSDFAEKKYCILVWPGTQDGLTITVNFKELGEYVKSAKNTIEFKPAKFYNLNFQNTEDLVVTEISNKIDEIEGKIPSDSDLDDLEAAVEALLAQIQSVSLMTEYLDNAAYARYSKFGSTNVKQDIELSYMVRPVEIAEQLVEKYSEALSAVVTYPGSDEYETLSVNSATLTDGILTVAVDAEEINNDFYSGAESAKLALQISSGRSDLLSDFANLHPKIGASLDFTRSKDIPVLKGARVSIPFKYAPNGDTYELSVSGNSDASLRDNSGFFNGYVNVDITDSDLASQSVTVVLNSGGEVIEEVLTFADAGKFDISYLATVDYVGGEVNVFVDKSESYGAYTMTLSNNSIGTDYRSLVGKYVQDKTYYNTWIYEKNSGVQGTYFIDENGPTKATVIDENGEDKELEVNNGGVNPRTANLNFAVKNANPAVNGDLTYTRSISITQRAYGTGFVESQYYSSGTVLTLKTATSHTSKHLNLVILGDGYKKSHLLKTGTFEGSARSAADVFLNAIDKDFRDRFNVYALVRESSNSGVASSVEGAAGYTYYETFWNGTSVGISANGKEKVKKDVKSKCTVESFDYYRTVAIVLMNSNADRGASDYEFGKTSTSNVGDGYASFGYTMVPAYSTGTNGLIRHEGVGHCLGRLGDEYPTDHHTVPLVNERHDNGFYRNIATDKNYWSAFRDAGYTADEVDYVNYFDENGNVVKEGLYRSVNNKGIMFNNNGTFNAVSRWAIYDRIRKQTEGYGDYWNDFLIWDNKNRNK